MGGTAARTGPGAAAGAWAAAAGSFAVFPGPQAARTVATSRTAIVGGFPKIVFVISALSLGGYVSRTRDYKAADDPSQTEVRLTPLPLALIIKR
jgi:hypothetical protein